MALDPATLRAHQEAALARSPSIRALEVGPGAVAEAGRLWRETIGDRPALIVADDNTWAAAGPATQAALDTAGIATDTHILAATPRVKPARELGEAIAAKLPAGAAFVAVGAGVLNDLVKYAAFARDVPYLCVATAASMDGYTSAGAPLTDRGFKITIECRPARAVIGDLDVIAAAPPAMIGWGYGDMAGKVPAGADWIVADALGVEPVDEVAWPMVQTHLADLLGAPDAVARGAPDAVAAVFAGLSLVGLAMEAHGSTRPASGAEHQIAHIWEMESLAHGGERVSHGACVAVGCMATLRLYDWLLGRDLAALDIEATLAAAPDLAAKRAAIARHFSGEIARRAGDETAAKHPDPQTHRARLATLKAAWPDLAARLRAQLWPPETMADHLRRAGAPAAPEDIGISQARLAQTIAAARFLRRRYTILDLLGETGLLAQALSDLYGTDGEP